MSPRLPRLGPDEMDDAQRAVYVAITGGDRATGPQHFPLSAADGSLHGPFGPMVLAPGVGAPLQALGSAIRFQTDLPARCREIAVLHVARATGSAFEWWAHERVARAAGLTDDELAAISLGTFHSDDPTEEAVSAFCTLLLESDEVRDEEFATFAAVVSHRQLTELTVLVGYYRTLAQLMAVFDIGVPIT